MKIIRFILSPLVFSFHLVLIILMGLGLILIKTADYEEGEIETWGELIIHLITFPFIETWKYINGQGFP